SMGMSTGYRGRWAYVRGVMGRVSAAFASAARVHGVEIRTNAEVDHIAIRDGRATGVITTAGDELSAKIVLSNADPKRTYQRLVDPKQLPDVFRRDIDAIQIESPVVKINLAMEELPRFTALEQNGADTAWGNTGGLMIGPTIDYLQRAYDDAR